MHPLRFVTRTTVFLTFLLLNALLLLSWGQPSSWKTAAVAPIGETSFNPTVQTNLAYDFVHLVDTATPRTDLGFNASAPTGPTVTGTWHGSYKWDAPNGQTICIDQCFTENSLGLFNGSITFSCASIYTAYLTGSRTGSNLSWTVPDGKGGVVYSFAGTVSGDIITGRFSQHSGDGSIQLSADLSITRNSTAACTSAPPTPTPSPSPSPSPTPKPTPSPSPSPSPTPTPTPTVSISGHVFDSTLQSPNNGIAGVTVQLSGGKTTSATTAADGSYSITGLAAGGNYNVTPTLKDYSFTPTGQTFNNLISDQTADFKTSCGDERDDIIKEYKDNKVGLIPKCSDFVLNARTIYFPYEQLNGGDFTWSLLQPTLLGNALSSQGLDKWREEYGGPRTLNSVYRSPKHNAAIGGAKQSRHMFGDAADMRNDSRTEDEWKKMKLAAQRANAHWIEPRNGPCKVGCVHADWRPYGPGLPGFPGYKVQDKAGAAGNVDIPALLTQIQSLDPQVREQGFNALLQAGNNGSTDAITYPVPLQVANLLTAYPDQATNIRSEFIRLLEREIAYAQGVPEAVGLSEEYVGYQADVTAAVASLKDVRSINGLVAAIDTGGLATNTLSGFGASALDSVIAALNNDDSTARNGAAITLSHLHVADPLAMEKLRLGLLKAANDPDPFVRRTADEGLTGLNLNAIDDPPLFVAQHYRDFLGREPDQAGLPFWTGEITSCGGNSQCADVKRVNVSAAFYLSMEFQQTGYLIYRIYKASFGNLADIPNAPVPIKREEFLPDTQEIGNGVIVNQGNWQQELESNKQAFILEFVQRPRFVTAFPTTMTPAQFADKLFANAGVSPTAIDRNAAIAEFGSATTSADVTARSRALRDVAENATLNTREFNKAFVLMQYFGYLRRNPYDPPEASLDYSGFNFWLGKLNHFGGNYIDAEMVKAFISSDEYRHRFGP